MSGCLNSKALIMSYMFSHKKHIWVRPFCRLQLGFGVNVSGSFSLLASATIWTGLNRTDAPCGSVTAWLIQALCSHSKKKGSRMSHSSSSAVSPHHCTFHLPLFLSSCLVSSFSCLWQFAILSLLCTPIHLSSHVSLMLVAWLSLSWPCSLPLSLVLYGILVHVSQG